MEIAGRTTAEVDFTTWIFLPLKPEEVILKDLISLPDILDALSFSIGFELIL